MASGPHGHNARVSFVLAAAGSGRTEGATPFEAVFALRPNLFEDFRRFYALFWEKRLVDPVLLELCRLRIARCTAASRSCACAIGPRSTQGSREAKIAALADAAHSPLYSEAERACIALAELFAMDPHAITDADAARVVAALGDAGTVALVEALALFDGFTRFRADARSRGAGRASRRARAARRRGSALLSAPR